MASDSTRARTRAIRRTATGRRVRDMLMIFNDIDPEGHFKVILDERAVPPPAAMDVAPMSEDALALNLIILQGDQLAYHQRSEEEPPTHCLEDEAESEESDEREMDAGSATSGPPGKVTEGNVAVLGVLDKAAAGVDVAFGSVMERHESGPAK